MKFPGRDGRGGFSKTERGFSLIVALIMLIVIIILGVSSSQMAINEERGARNDRDRQIAFQAAEAALKDAELEILGASSPACGISGQPGHGRAGSLFCFNESSAFIANCGAAPSLAQGLCSTSVTAPAYLSTNVNFYGDAAGSGGFGTTVQYGQFTGASYPSQLTAGLAGLPIAKYPPRYIIETIPKNVASSFSLTDKSGGTAVSAAAGGLGRSMFRITAMGFGANANSQVVLQSVVSTQD